MSFGKPKRCSIDAERSLRGRRRRRWAASALTVVAALGAVFVAAPNAAAGYDEPDLVPFRGAYALGCTWDNGCGNGHHGASRPAVDFPMPEGVPIVAAGDGVARLYQDSCAGKYIEVWHSGVRKYSRYLHLSAYAVVDGAAVNRGQIIGYSGNTGAEGGCSTGAHLHYDELNSSRQRIDPGPMVGLSGTTWVTYPAALGVSSWNQMGAFFGPAVRNDHTTTTGTPTTLAATTTTAVTTPPATAPPTTAVPRRTLPEGTLFRAADAANVYVFAGGSPWWVPDPTQLDLLGGWGAVQVAGPELDTLLSAMPWRPLQHRAFVEAGDGQMWWCAGGSPWPLSSMTELAALQARTGGGGWSRLPAGAAGEQWACGGTTAGTVFQRRGAPDHWVWTGTGWTAFPDAAATAAAGYSTAVVHVLPAG